MSYSEKSTAQLITEINRADKKLLKIKSEGALWVLGIQIRTIRSELDKRIKDPDKVTKMILEAKK